MRKITKLIILLCLFISCGRRDIELRKKSEIIIEAIERYKEEKGKIPDKLNQIGIEELEEGPIYYVPWSDSTNYIIYYTIGGVGESIKYYSDTKKWEYIDRGINK